MAADKIDITVTKLRSGDQIKIRHSAGTLIIQIDIVAEGPSRAAQTAFDTSNISPKVDEAVEAVKRLAEALEESDYVASTSIAGTVITVTLVNQSEFDLNGSAVPPANGSVEYTTTNGSLMHSVKMIEHSGQIHDKVTDPALYFDPLVANILITSVTHQLLDYGYSANTFPTGNVGDVIKTTINFTVADTFVSLDFKFGWIKNSTTLYTGLNSLKLDPSYFESLYDGTPQSYIGDTTSMRAVAPFTWVTGTVILTNISGNDYSLVHTHTAPILPRIEDLSGFNYVIPEEITGSESLKYPFEINLSQNIIDPNPSETTQLQDLTNFIQNGSLGSFGQVYKTGINHYNLVSFAWTTPTTLLNNGIQSTSTAIISSDFNLSSTSEVTVTIMEVTDTLLENQTLLQSLSYDRVQVDADAIDGNSAILKKVNASLNSPTEVLLTFEVEKALMQNTYIIWVEINDDNVTHNNQNLILTIDEVQTAADDSVVNFMIHDDAPYDEYIFNYHWNDDITEGFNQIKSFVEDINIARFQIQNTDTVNTTLIRWELKIFSRTNNTVLEEFSIQASDLPFTQTRIFDLGPSSIRKDITVTEITTGVYQFAYPFQIWLDWVSVDNVVVQVTGVFDQLVATGDVLGFRNRWLSPDFELGNYDETKNTASEPQALRTAASMQFFTHPANTALSKIQNTGQTRVLATFQDDNLNDLQSNEVSFPTVKTTTNTDVGNLCAYFGITTDSRTQAEYLRFHNVRENPTSTLWEEVTGHETNYAKLTIVTIDNATVEAIIDADALKVRFGTDFKNLFVSCRLDKFQTNTGAPVIPFISFLTTFEVPNDGIFDPNTNWGAAFQRTWELVDGTQILNDDLAIATRVGLTTNELNNVQQEVKLMIPSGESFGDLTTISIVGVEGVGQLDITALTGVTTIDIQDNLFSDVLFAPATASLASIFMQNNNVTGTFDISSLGSLWSGTFNCDGNNITAIANPASTGTLTSYIFSNNNVTGTQNLSTLSLSGQLSGSLNPNMVAVNLPTPVGIINDLQFENCNFTTFNPTTLAGLWEGNFRIALNPGLTSITFPALSGPFTRMSLFGCAFAGTWTDVSGLGNNFAGNIDLGTNPFTQVTLPTSSASINPFKVQTCANLTSLDLTSLTGLLGDIDLANNAVITTITLPATYGGTVTDFRADDCPLLTSLNVSALTTLSTRFEVANTGLASIDMPVTSGAFSFIDVSESPSLTSFRLDNITGLITGTLDIENGNMAVADCELVLDDIDANGGTGGTITLTGNPGAGSVVTSDPSSYFTLTDSKGWTINL